MNDSGDDGLCDGDSNLKKIRIQIYKNAEPSVVQKDSKLVQKQFMCGRCDRGLWGVKSMNSMKSVIKLRLRSIPNFK